MVIAVREDSFGTYIGFRVDREILECRECTKPAAYRLRYTEDEESNLAQHRFAARRAIDTEHPKHNDKLRIC